jgi:hypothetical protein
MLSDSIFLRVPLKISAVSRLSVLAFASLTVSRVALNLHSIRIQGKLQLFGGALTCEDCTFPPYDDETRWPIEFYAGTVAEFRSCTFRAGTNAAVLCRTRARALFSNCAFEFSPSESLRVLEEASVVLNDCQFEGAGTFAVYLAGQCRAVIERSSFLEQGGRAIFLVSDCVGSISHSEFRGNESGAIGLTRNSTIFVCDTTFSGGSKISLRIMSNSLAKIENCVFASGSGAAISFENSTGSVKSCTISDFSKALFVLGCASNPVISDCRITHCKSSAIFARDACAPTFTDVVVDGINGHAFVLSDFSRPRIVHSTITNCKAAPFTVYNGSSPSISHNKIDCGGHPAFMAFTAGYPTFRQNVFVAPGDFSSRTPFLEAQFLGNLLFDGDTYFRLSVRESRLWQSRAATTNPPQNHNHSGVAPQPLINVSSLGIRPEACGGPCLICHAGHANLICAPCGHMVACDHCAEQLRAEGAPACPVCATPVKHCVRLFQSERCVVCMDAPPDAVMLPCGHRCLCYACAAQACAVRMSCPMCQAEVSACRHMFSVDSGVKQVEGERLMNLKRTASCPQSAWVALQN